MWSSEKIRKSLRDLLWLDRRGKPRHEVVLAHSCRHFGECYPLNRLAALLMARAFAGAQGMSDTSAVVWEGYRLERVTPADGHRCGDASSAHNGNPAASALACHGRSHPRLERGRGEERRRRPCSSPTDLLGKRLIRRGAIPSRSD